MTNTIATVNGTTYSVVGSGGGGMALTDKGWTTLQFNNSHTTSELIGYTIKVIDLRYDPSYHQEAERLKLNKTGWIEILKGKNIIDVIKLRHALDFSGIPDVEFMEIMVTINSRHDLEVKKD